MTGPEIRELKADRLATRSPCQETDEALQLGLYVLSSAASDAGESHPLHVREAALKLLRQIVSTATPSALHRRIIDDLYASLLLVDPTSPYDLIVAHLKLFETVSVRCAKQRDPDTLGQLASRLQAFSFAGTTSDAPGPRAALFRAAPKDRVQASTAPVNGSAVASAPMGTFGLSGNQATSIGRSSRQPRRQTSASSLSSVRSSRSDRSARSPARYACIRAVSLRIYISVLTPAWGFVNCQLRLYRCATRSAASSGSLRQNRMEGASSILGPLPRPRQTLAPLASRL